MPTMSNIERLLRLIRSDMSGMWLLQFSFYRFLIKKNKFDANLDRIWSWKIPARDALCISACLRARTRIRIMVLCVYSASHNLRKRIIHVTYCTIVEYEMTHSATKQHVYTSHALLFLSLSLPHFIYYISLTSSGIIEYDNIKIHFQWLL